MSIMALTDTTLSSSSNSVLSEYNLVVVDVSGFYDIYRDINSSESSSDSTPSDVSGAAGSAEEMKEDHQVELLAAVLKGHYLPRNVSSGQS
jgi:hypothetical protein